MSPGGRDGAPIPFAWVIRLLIRLLPAESRDLIGEPLERTIADVVQDPAVARHRSRLLWSEVWSLGGMVLRERFGAEARARLREGMTTMMTQDIRYAFRSLRGTPGVTLVSILTLVVGLGSSTAIFTMIQGVLLDPLPYVSPEEVVLIGEVSPQGQGGQFSWENFVDVRESGVFEDVAVLMGNSVAVTGDGEPERIRGLFVSSSWFDMAGVQPALGRGIAPGEERAGDPRTAVLSWGYWQQRFGGDPEVLGRAITLNDEVHTIVGVMPEGFRSVWDTPSAWISMHTLPRDMSRGARGLIALARLRKGDNVDGARTGLARFYSDLSDRYPDTNAGWTTTLESAEERFSARNRSLFVGLAVAVGILLLIACTNVASLQLARSMDRRPEMALRSALGSGRHRIVRQLLVESVILFGVSGGLGFAFASLILRGFSHLQPAIFEFYTVSIGTPVILFGVVLTALSATLFGLVPALDGGSVEPAKVLQHGSRSGGSRRSQRFRSGLVVTQMMLSLALMVGASLLLRSLNALTSVDPGFDAPDLLTLEFRVTDREFTEPAALLNFYQNILERIGGVPGVLNVGLASDLPFSGNGGSIPFVPEGQVFDETAGTVRLNRVSPSYFETMGIPLIRGRSFDQTDNGEAPLVALIAESTAERFFGEEDPVGRRFFVTEEISAVIVGVVGDVRLRLDGAPEPYAYVAYPQELPTFASLAVRTRGEPMSLEAAVKEAIWSANANQAVWEVMPIEERMATYAADQRFGSTLLLAFGGTALLLASLGLYGVISYSVKQRRRELGIRLALGAEGGEVLSLVMRQGVTLVALGLGLGLVLSWAMSRLLRSLLFQVDAGDPLSFLASAGILALVAVFAAWLPARQAVRIDPAKTLADA